MRRPKYRHYRPKNLGVVRINGIDHYLGRYKSPESWEKYHRLLEAAGFQPPESSGTVDEVVLAFLKAHKDHYRRADGTQTGELDNFVDALRPLVEKFGPTSAKDFSPKGLKAVRQAMIDSGLARTTINQRVRRIVRVFKWAASEELVPGSVHADLKTVDGLQKGRSAAREPEPVGPVDDAVVDSIEPYVSRQVWAMIQLQRLTGMRPGEVVIMRSGDIKDGVYTPDHHKTEHKGKGRAIPLGPRARALLEPWLKADPKAYLFSPREATEERLAAMRAGRRTKVQPSQENRAKGGKRRPGPRYTVNSYGGAIWKACKRAAVDSWHSNQLRHSFGTLLRREFDLDTARAGLGHSDSATTLIYAERDRAVAARAIEQVG